MNKINPKKLLNSKWTAVNPVKKEKHFIISKLKLNDVGDVEICEIEAVMTKRVAQMDWMTLCDQSNWLHGWQ